MAEIDKERILNASLHKRLVRGYDEMKSTGLTQESADAYKTIYKDEPLSSILNESELIFKEPLNGLSFYESIMLNEKIPLHRFVEERTKLHEFMETYGNAMSDEQRQLYESVITNVDKVMNKRKHEICLAGYLSITEAEKEGLDAVCDAYYEKKGEKNIPEIDAFFESTDNGMKLLYGYYILPPYKPNQLSSFLYKEMTVTESTESNIESYTMTTYANIVSSYLMEDVALRNEIEKVPNYGLRNIAMESALANYHSVVDEIFTEHVTEAPMYVNPENAVMQVFFDDTYYETMQDLCLKTRIVNAARAKAVFESLSGIAFAEMMAYGFDAPVSSKVLLEMTGTDSVTTKEAFDFFAEKMNMMSDIINIGLADESADEDESFFEFTRRGEATPVIRKSAGNLREEPFADKKKKKASDDSSDDTDENEDEEDEDEKELEREHQKEVKKKSAVPEKKESDRIREREPKEKPEMQKQTITRKIQNKAMDADMKMQKKAANVKQGATELKNAAKSVLRLPGNIIKAMKTSIEEFNTADENRRKELIMKPGYRTQIFKYLKTAITYGAIWQYKKYMVIVAFICKHTFLHPIFKADANRTKRLRNELTAELETEIAVTEEKIQDANANGDQKQKYELIRIKKKLEAEKVRVAANSKYI